MKTENKTIFVKRLKSFLWRTGMMALSGLVAFLGANIGLFEMSAELTVIIGLVLGEVSKHLNK